VFKTQFPFPSTARLVETYGESSPMGLLWTFMGYSTAYNVFTGGAEVVGGGLLFFRRTTTLGALVVSAVMANVVMLNFSYDVPVKLYSSLLLLTALYLALPDLGRLVDVLVRHRPTTPAPVGWPPHSRRVRIGRWALKLAFIGAVLYTNVSGSLAMQRQIADTTPRDPLCGSYEVEEFARGGVTVAPLTTESRRWRRVYVLQRGLLAQRMDDARERYAWHRDDAKRTLTLTAFGTGKPAEYVLALGKPDDAHVTLDGKLGDDAVRVRLRRLPEEKFPLVERGFHWINEFPFNR
jgi:hypothetical protein